MHSLKESHPHSMTLLNVPGVSSLCCTPPMTWTPTPDLLTGTRHPTNTVWSSGRHHSTHRKRGMRRVVRDLFQKPVFILFKVLDRRHRLLYLWDMPDSLRIHKTGVYAPTIPIALSQREHAMELATGKTEAQRMNTAQSSSGPNSRIRAYNRTKPSDGTKTLADVLTRSRVRTTPT